MNEAAFAQNTNNMLDIFVILAGVYLICSSIVMKVRGEIPKSLISKNIDPDRAKDKPGYIEHMFLPCIFMGILLVAGGGVFTVFSFLHIEMPAMAPTVFYLGSMAIIIAFGVYTMNMQRRYLRE